MAATTVANWKIEKCADFFASKFKKQSEEKRLELIEYINNHFNGLTPKDVLQFQKKYPDIIKTKTSICDYISINGEKEYTDIYNLDFVNMEVFKPKEFIETDEIAIRLITEQKELSKKAKQTFNKVECTLSKLRSYNRIKNEFPEAYKFIMEEVDDMPVQTKDLCTDIEKLRAELNG